ncbi:MAG: Crp/Fnr family transcriptional regulator [Oscillospiraceae bacterium]|nr:Crp/Fnr family transcriptional regulator [Oscillospiraceae bacterium]
MNIIPPNLPLFAGILQEDLPSLLYCVRATVETYKKRQTIISQGETVSNFGILLSGQARSLKLDADGRQVIVTLIRPGGVVGIILAAVTGERSLVEVVAEEDSRLLSIPFARIGAVCDCGGACRGREQLAANYTSLLARKALELHERIDCLLEPSVRSKVLTYLRRLAMEEGEGASKIALPFDREGMAEYLNVDRSALSRELSRMKREGLIDYRKNIFLLKAQC